MTVLPSPMTGLILLMTKLYMEHSEASQAKWILVFVLGA